MTLRGDPDVNDAMSSTSVMNLGEAEQDALLWLASRLLRLEWPMAPAALERLTLQWLDWRDACPARDAPDPRPTPAAFPDPEPEAASGLDAHSRKAIEVLRRGSGQVALRFLASLASVDGTSEVEEDFLTQLRVALGHVQRGVFR